MIATSTTTLHTQAGRAFEVASIKPAAAGRGRAGVRMDASRVEFTGVSLADLLAAAFQVKRSQLRGRKALAAGVNANAGRFDVRAALPPGATADQIPEMLQALLAERFGLVYHREPTEHAVFGLTVAARGPRLTPSSEPADASAARVRTSTTPEGATHLEADGMTMAALADLLSHYLDRPVVDATGVTGRYTVGLTLSREDITSAARSAGLAVPPDALASSIPANGDGVAGVSIVRSLDELGLALEPRTALLDDIVVDRLEPEPTPD